MSKMQTQKTKRKPDTVVATFSLFGDFHWEWHIVDGLEHGDLTPEIIAKIAAAGDELKARLEKSARLLTKLRARGWNGLGDLIYLTLSKETTREKALDELSQLGIPPDAIELQEVMTDKDYGWVDLGDRFTIPKDADKGKASLSVQDLDRMKVELHLMENALRRERQKNQRPKKAATRRSSRATRLEKKNDVLINALRIISTYLEEMATQPDIRRDWLR